MMLDWVNVGTDSDHWTVKVNVRMLMLTIVLSALATQVLTRPIINVSSPAKSLSKSQLTESNKDNF